MKERRNKEMKEENEYIKGRRRGNKEKKRGKNMVGKLGKTRKEVMTKSEEKRDEETRKGKRQGDETRKGEEEWKGNVMDRKDVRK